MVNKMMANERKAMVLVALRLKLLEQSNAGTHR
jgi:hypothetical protein